MNRWAQRGGSSLEADDDGDSGRLSRFSDGASAGVSGGFPSSGISDARCPKDMKETWFLIQLVVWQEGLQHVRLCDKNVAHPPLARQGGCLWTRLGREHTSTESRCVCKARRPPCALPTVGLSKGASFLLCVGCFPF